MNELTCQELIDFISEYIDGNLPAPTVAEFEAHLQICPDCTAYLNNFRMTLRATKTAFDSPQVESALPENLVQAILASRKK